MKQLILAILCGSLTTLLFAQPIPVDDRVRMGQLENGMHYYIQHNEKPEDRVEIRMAVKAGSVLEDEDQKGLAHFVEHMAFNGTENFEKNELIDYLESCGTRFGPDLNAYTSFDETVYMLQARTDDKDMLQTGLLIFEDWAGGLLFDEEEIDKERGVVKSEWRSRLSPNQRMQNKYFPVLYNESQYAQRLPIGDPDIIDNAPYDALKRFYRDWYRPDLMCIVMVGDIDVDEMEQEIITRFSGLTNPASPRERTRFDVPEHEETLVSIASDKETSFTSVRVLIKHPHFEVNDIPTFRQSILHSLYNRMMNARLDELARSPEPPFSFAFSGYGRDIGDIDRYSSFARTGEGKALEGLKAMLMEIERARRFGFTDSELARQKTELLTNIESAVKEQDKVQSGRLAMKYVYHFLEDNPIPSPQQRFDIYQGLLPTVTLEEINALSSQWLTESNRVIVITGPDKEEVPMPNEDQVENILMQVDEAILTPYEDEIVDDVLFDLELEPGLIEHVVYMEDINVYEWELNNGVKIVVKQTDFQNDEVLMRASSEGGHSNYDDSVYPSARFASGIINESGVGNFDAIQLEKKLSGNIVSVGPYIGENYEGFYGDASPKDLEILFQLVHLYFTAPREDADAYQSFIARQENLFENLMSNPSYYFSDYATKLKTNNHPRRGYPTLETLASMDLKEAMRIYRDRFSDASDFTFFFVGNFDLEQLEQYAKTYLATLPTSQREETWKDVGVRYQQGVVDKAIKRGKAPKTQVDMTFHGEFDWNPENRYVFNSMLSALRIKLRETMREDKGGVYGVRCSGNASRIPIEQYSITVSFNSDPDRTQELIDAATGVIKQYQEEAFDEEVLQKVRETQIQGRTKSLKENRYWLGQLVSAYNNDTDPQNISLEKLGESQANLTADNLLEAAQRYFNWDNYFKIVMEPEETKDEG